MTIGAVPRHSKRQAARLGLFYAASFLVVGIQLPFWPVGLSGRGLDATAIATVFAAAIWAKVFATPALGARPDRLGLPAGVRAALAALARSADAALWPVAGGSGWLAPGPRPCRHATSAITASGPCIGGSSGFPTR